MGAHSWGPGPVLAAGAKCGQKSLGECGWWVWALGRAGPDQVSDLFSFLLRARYSSLRMNGDQKLDAFEQEKQNFLQGFPEIVKVLTEDMEHPEIKEAIDRLKQVRDLHLTSESLVTLGMRGIQLWLWGDF